MKAIGADPELFVCTPTGKHISSVHLFGGSKEHPKDIGEGCAIQEDNVSVEFNIPPSQNLEQFKKSIRYAMNNINQRATELGLTLSEVAATVFDEDQLQTIEAQTFGCDPDYNAWSLERNPRPEATDGALRSCGGHIHVATNKEKHIVVRAMDLFLALPSVILDPDNKRRQLYGKAGAFRPKPYGVEYRTLSNFWIWKDNLIDWVYHQTALAEQTASPKLLGVRVANKLQQTINTGNVEDAKALITAYNIEMP